MAEPQKRFDPIPACLFAWLVPGAGHFFLRRRGRAAFFGGSLVALFVIGLLWDASLVPEMSFDDPLAAPLDLEPRSPVIAARTETGLAGVRRVPAWP